MIHIGRCREGNSFYREWRMKDSLWFVIDKNTHQVVRGQDLNNICREMGVPYPTERFRFETFLTRWNRVEQ